jgi:hypothetical protein
VSSLALKAFTNVMKHQTDKNNVATQKLWFAAPLEKGIKRHMNSPFKQGSPQ